MSARDIVMAAAGGAGFDPNAPWNVATNSPGAIASFGFSFPAYSPTLNRYLFGCYISGQGYVAFSSDLKTFTHTFGTGLASYPYSVIWAGDKFVCANSESSVIKIFTSSDGINWTNRASGLAGVTNRFAYSGSVIVGVGVSGSIVSSSDGGITWTAQTSGTTNSLNDVVWTGSLFVAVGASGTVLTSPDGVTWTPRASGTANQLFGVAYMAGEGVVAVGASGTVITSATGDSAWSTLSSGTTNTLYGIAGNANIGYFNFVGASGTCGEIASNTVTRYGVNLYSPLATIRYVAYLNSKYIIWNSTSGIASIASADFFWPTEFEVGVMDAVIAWTTAYSGAAGLYVTSSIGPTFRSNDKKTWRISASGSSSQLLANAYCPTLNRFVTAGSSGALLTSDDNAVTWTARTSGVSTSLYSIVWAGSQFVVVGASGVVRTSPDGITWTGRTSGIASSLESVAWNASLLVAVGGGGVIITSPDGITWTGRTSGTTNQLYAVCWTGSQFVAVGNSGTIVTSPDGVTWTTRTSGTTTALFAVGSISSEVIYAVGASALILRSTDGGVTWSSESSGVATTKSFYSINCDSRTGIVVTGRNGTTQGVIIYK